MKQDWTQPGCPLGHHPPDGQVCPLSSVEAGAVVCVRKLATSPEIAERLREMGICEDRKLTLVTRDHNIICMVCNARVGLSGRLGDSILVEALRSELKAGLPAKGGPPTEPESL